MDINKLSKKELLKLAQSQTKKVNRRLDTLSKHNMEYSKAYRYVENRLVNKAYTKINKNDNVRFLQTKRELEKLTFNQLRSLVKKTSEYLETKSGTYYGQSQLERKAFNSFKNNPEYKEELKDLTYSQYREMFKTLSFASAWDRFSSSEVISIIGRIGSNKTIDIFENIDVRNSQLMDILDEVQKFENKNQ